ncbi:MAG: hypothetical protein ACK2UY_05905 [Anaerolineae bacterium]
MSRREWALAGLLAVAALVLGIVLHPLAIDDAFITYRYARNLAAGDGFLYNASDPVLSTTAPLWALVLSGGALLWSDIPALANTLSAIAIAVGAVLIFQLGRRERAAAVGALAASFYVLYPLLWLSLGLETAAFLALALGAVLAYRGGRLYLAAVLLALATLTRADALVLAAVLAADYLLWLAPASRSLSLRGASVVCERRSNPHLSQRRGLLRRQRRAPRNDDGEVAEDLLRSQKRLARNDVSWPARWRPALAAALYVAVMLPLLAWLTWRFGSPLPATLGAKRAQAELGITGFYAHTTYLQGLCLLARARLAQSGKYLLFIPAVLVGLARLWKRADWVRLLVAWGAAHLLAYALLGVTPYTWYYAPLVPGAAALMGLGIVESVRWLGRKGIGKLGNWGLGLAWAGLLLAALAWSDWAMVQALDGPLPPPEDPVSKVLPEAKVDVYERAGLWLHDNAPPGALVGVTEVGVMGYYSGRTMVDFLGLLEPGVARALARGDLYWALLRYQPDYLALTAVSPLYAYDLRADSWFQVAYVPVQTFDDARFWGSPLTIYRRQIERVPLFEPGDGGLPPGVQQLDVDLGGQIRLLRAVAGDDVARPGDVLALTLYWQATAPVEHDYTVFVHLLGRQDRVLAQRDTAPGLGARPTSGWTPGEVVADPYLVVLPQAAYTPDEAVWEVGLYDAVTGARLPLAGGGDNARFGDITIEPAAEPLRLDFGPVILTGYDLDRLDLTPGEVLNVSLHWAGGGRADVAVQLVSEQGDVIVRAAGDSSQVAYALVLPGGAPVGAYDLEILVADPATGVPLPLLGIDGQPRGDRARLTKIRVYPQ